MKRLLSGVLVIALGIVFAGCSTTPEETESALTQISNYLQTYDYDSAMNKLKELESSGDTTQVNQAKYMIAQSYYDTERYEQAFELFEELGSFQEADTFLHEKVMSLYSKGDISIDMALSYVTAYDLLSDKEKAFVDFCQSGSYYDGKDLLVYFKETGSTINGILYTDLSSYNRNNTAKGYLVWFYNPQYNENSRNATMFFHLEGREISNSFTGSTSLSLDLSEYFTPDNSFDIDMINRAIEEAE